MGIIKGTIWTSLSFLVVTIIYLLRISILTRFLDKSDFGLVAIVLFVLGFTNIFADMGISSALLSQKEITKKEYSSLYWGGIFLAVLLYCIIVLLSPAFVYFYDYEELNFLIPILGLDLIFSSIGRQFTVFKQKELKFKQLSLIKIVSELISLIVAVLLAVNGFGIWSLIVSLLVTSSLNSLLNMIWGYKSHPLKFYFNYQETKHLYKIGFYQTGAQILDYLSSQIDILILGKLLPMSEMGVYSIIKAFVFRVYSSINQIFTKVMVPLLAKVQEEPFLLKNMYLFIVNLISIINSFIYFIIFINAAIILKVLYGDAYVDYSVILQILTIWGLCSSIVNCSSAIIISTGKTHLGFKWTQFRIFLNPITIFIGAYYGGVIGVCISQAIYSLLTIILYWKIVINQISTIITLKDYINSLIVPLLIGGICLPVFYYLGLLYEVNEYLKFVISVLFLGIIFYFTLGRDTMLNIKKFGN